jgi:hypothetical protein
MKLTVLCSTIAAGMLFTLSASAQGQKTTSPPTTTTTRTADYVEQKDVQGDQVVKFTGDELEGANGAPGSSMMIRATGPIRVALIRPRLNFIPELLKSVENL